MSSLLLPYDTIIKAHEGDPIAIQAVLDRYAGYIRYFSKMNGYYNSDMEDYGMIDGIINNGPKEDKTAEVKAPERGEKSSIMDRLKSAKAEKQKDCCPPKKHKGEIEL